jgi:hypothetical protein
VNGTRTTSTASESMFGVMDVSIGANGGSIRCMGQECIPGRTAAVTREITTMTRSMVSESTVGQMVASLRDSGCKESVKAREGSSTSRVKLGKEYGVTTRDGTGQENNQITSPKQTMRSRSS